MELPSQTRNRQSRLIRTPQSTFARSTLPVEASRRLSFGSPLFYARTPRNSVEIGDVFVPDSPERDSYCWRPGQTLPTDTSQQVQLETMKSMLQEMSTSLERNLKDIKSNLTELESRVRDIEHKEQQQLTPITTSSTDSSESEFRRQRRSPSDLQHDIRLIHGALDDDNQLNPDERIDSKHNMKVIGTIVQEIGSSKYTKTQIQNGVKIYRKSIKEASKGRPMDTKAKIRIRSRQQRLFERRTKMLKNTEAKFWREVKPDMMSEEEEDSEGFVRHRYTWRSKLLNALIEKLDRRSSSKNHKSLARNRTYGVPFHKLAPKNIPSWMKEKDTIPTAAEPTPASTTIDTAPTATEVSANLDSSDELFSSSDHESD